MSLWGTALHVLQYRQQACLPRDRAASKHTEPQEETNTRGSGHLETETNQVTFDSTLTQPSRVILWREGPVSTIGCPFGWRWHQRDKITELDKIKVYSVLAIVMISRMAFKPNSVSMVLIQPSSATVFWSVLPVGCRHSFNRCHYFYEWILTSLLIHALQPSPNSTPTHPQLHRVYHHQDPPSFECTLISTQKRPSSKVQCSHGRGLSATLW